MFEPLSCATVNRVRAEVDEDIFIKSVAFDLSAAAAAVCGKFRLVWVRDAGYRSIAVQSRATVRLASELRVGGGRPGRGRDRIRVLSLAYWQRFRITVLYL